MNGINKFQMKIEGKTVSVKKSNVEVFNFLADFNNFEKLMPEEVIKFEADETSFVFAIKGMPEIRLVKKSENKHDNITLEAASSKLPVELEANITNIDDSSSEVKLTFNGNFNPMIKMMVQKPLTKFIETLSDNIQNI